MEKVKTCITRERAIQWTLNLWRQCLSVCSNVALENPVSVIFTELKNYHIQYIQPWMFGHGETKKTGLCLYNLPDLKPTNIVDGREQKIWKMSPGPERKTLRSKTYQGIADAIAMQWSEYLLSPDYPPEE